MAATAPRTARQGVSSTNPRLEICRSCEGPSHPSPFQGRGGTAHHPPSLLTLSKEISVYPPLLMLNKGALPRSFSRGFRTCLAHSAGPKSVDTMGGGGGREVLTGREAARAAQRAMRRLFSETLSHSPLVSSLEKPPPQPPPYLPLPSGSLLHYCCCQQLWGGRASAPPVRVDPPGTTLPGDGSEPRYLRDHA